jgi:hypothetical protein
MNDRCDDRAFEPVPSAERLADTCLMAASTLVISVLALAASAASLAPPVNAVAEMSMLMPAASNCMFTPETSIVEVASALASD